MIMNRVPINNIISSACLSSSSVCSVSASSSAFDAVFKCKENTFVFVDSDFSFPPFHFSLPVVQGLQGHNKLGHVPTAFRAKSLAHAMANFCGTGQHPADDEDNEVTDLTGVAAAAVQDAKHKTPFCAICPSYDWTKTGQTVTSTRGECWMMMSFICSCRNKT